MSVDENATPYRLDELVAELHALGDKITPESLEKLIGRTTLTINDVRHLVTPNPATYSRQRVALTDTFEVLVMTWLPGQGSGPHDHGGSLSGYMILSGAGLETHYTRSFAGCVTPGKTVELREGATGLDPGDVIHAMRNDESQLETLVSLHVYAPPLPELRRYALRPAEPWVDEVLSRRRVSSAPTIAIIGGGFSGVMAAANCLRQSSERGEPVNIVVVDRQTSVAEGAAYRTADDRHMLNVPAMGMSAWPDRPGHFLAWA